MTACPEGRRSVNITKPKPARQPRITPPDSSFLSRSEQGVLQVYPAGQLDDGETAVKPQFPEYGAVYPIRDCIRSFRLPRAET